MQANLRRIRARVLKQQLHLNRTEAQKVLDRILHKVALHGGRITQAGLTRQEMQAVQLLLSFFKGGSLFTDNDLFEDFCRALIKQNLLTGDEKAQLKRSKAAITLFALAAMHNKAVALGNGHKAELAIAPSKNQKDLSVFAFSDVANDAMGNISAALWVFETQLPIADFCDANVPPPERGAFFGDIEMTSDGRKLKRT